MFTLALWIDIGKVLFFMNKKLGFENGTLGFTENNRNDGFTNAVVGYNIDNTSVDWYCVIIVLKALVFGMNCECTQICLDRYFHRFHFHWKLTLFVQITFFKER